MKIDVKNRMCKCKMEVMEYGILVDEYKCEREAGHDGVHAGYNKARVTVTWSNMSAIRSRVENEYKDLPK